MVDCEHRYCGKRYLFAKALSKRFYALVLFFGFFQKTERYSSYPVYHSVYETFEIVEQFYDPSFRRLRAVAQVRGGLTVLLANSQLLPLDANEYADALGKYAQSIAQLAAKNPDEMVKYEVSFGKLCRWCHKPCEKTSLIKSGNFTLQIPCFLQYRTSLLQPEISMKSLNRDE